MNSARLTLSRILDALPGLTAFFGKIWLAWLAVNMLDVIALDGIMRTSLASASINGYRAFAVLSVGAFLGWIAGWRDGRRREG